MSGNSRTVDNPLQIIVALGLLLVVFAVYIVYNVNTAKHGVSSSSQLAAAVAGVSLSASPVTGSVTVGNTFTVNILLNSNGQDVYGVDINSLRFNPALLEVVDSDSNISGVQISPGSLLGGTQYNTVNNTTGAIQFSQIALYDEALKTFRTYKGSGTLATITFRAKAAGVSTLIFDYSIGASTDSNVVGLDGDMLASVTDGSYTVTEALDTTPPTISEVVLSQVTASSVTISWKTNEPATTKVNYGLTTSYGQGSTLVSTLTTTHSVTLTGLAAGTSYHYQVLSADARSNQSLSGDNTFTTQLSPDTTPPTVPTGLSATAVSNKEIQLSWTASTDTAGAGQEASGVKHYRVYRDGGATAITTTANTAYLDSGLLPNHTYSYDVVAVDQSLNSSAHSASVSAKTTNTPAVIQRQIRISLEGAPSGKRNVSGIIQFLNPANKAVVHTANITTNAGGDYVMSIPNGLPSTVTFRIKIIGYIARLLTNVDISDASLLNVQLPSLAAGDLNNDQIINTLDFSYMNGKWSTNDSLADINKDGTVNSIDFSYISKNWLATGE